jgi:2-keto-4-pentenoate hydratase/2-oxohepta-3-ene-1,7-dioic acid hydratase in catechol pathway
MKIFCVGRNYINHAKELNNAVPDEPIIFMKPKNALVQKGNPLYYPAFTNELHYEGELVLRVGKNGKYINERYAMQYIDAVTVGIDFTARDLQNNLKEKGLPWEKAKAFDGSAVVGRFLPINDFANMQSINFSLNLNDQEVQKGNPKEMLFSINKIIANITQYFTLNIGDLIYTGTPEGVGECSVADKFTGFINGEEVFDVTMQ